MCPVAGDIVIDPEFGPQENLAAACASLKKASKRAKCSYKAAVAKCKATKKGKKRVKCIKKAKRTYAVKKCKSTKKGSARTRCITKAKRA